MNELYLLIDNTTRKFQRKSYKTTDLADKKFLRDNMDTMTIQCCCENKVEMKISSRHYFYSAKKSDKHDTECMKHSHYQSNSEYDKGWKTDEEGNHSVRLGSLIPKEKKEIVDKESEEIRGRIYSGTSITKYKVEMLGLISKINMMTWERMACDYHKNPENIDKFNDSLYYTLSTVKPIGTNLTLKELEYKKKNIKDMKANKDIAFIYMYVDDLEDKGTYCFLKVKDRYGTIHRFYVNKEEYQEEMNKERGHSELLVIGGFVYKKSKNSNILTLGKFALMPISSQGLYVESSYEKITYETFHKENRVFYKPYTELAEYGGKMPDIILVDRKKKIIGEIFGLSTPEYLENRENKLRLAEEISDIYDFWKWDAYKKDELVLPD